MATILSAFWEKFIAEYAADDIYWYFPKGGTFVIEAYSNPGSTTLHPSLSFMAVGTAPTCAVPQVTGPISSRPTH